MSTQTTNAPLVVAGAIHIDRKGRGAQKVIRTGSAPSPPEPGRVPRVARLMALAIRFDQLVREGVVADYAELARLGHVTRARVTQVMNLLYLAPDIQEAVLHLPRTVMGRDRLMLRDLLPITADADWRTQRKLWARLSSSHL
jgi:hypothetical protein